jgi:hypothetical protein
LVGRELTTRRNRGEYDSHPVALIVTGTSTSAVTAACDSATFYDNAQLADRVG